MESSETNMLNDDGIQAPLIQRDDDTDSAYRIEASEHTRKTSRSLNIDANRSVCLDGTPARYVRSAIGWKRNLSELFRWWAFGRFLAFCVCTH